MCICITSKNIFLNKFKFKIKWILKNIPEKKPIQLIIH